MNCSNCGEEIPQGSNFCQYCGGALAGAPVAGSGGSSLDAETAGDAEPVALRETVLGLQAEVAELSRRLRALESVRPVPGSAPAPARPVAPPPTVAQSAAPRADAPPSGAASAPPDAPAGGGPPGNLPGILSPSEWEWLLGGNWLARVGILALIFGIGFFLKLAFDNDWIGETGRVVLGLAVGVALLGGGEYWSRRYPAWAQAVTGGGIAVLYLSIFAAFALYDLVPSLGALGFSFLVTLAAAGLALRYESRAIAVLGILGGFATPLILADRLPEQWALLAYVLVLDLGVLALATFRNWRWFTLLALIGSLVLFGFWYFELEPGLLLAQVGITVIFLIFVGATTLFHLLWRRPPGPLDQALMVLNAAAYFGISYALLFEEFRVWMGGFTLLLALFYGLLGYGIVARHREQAHLGLFALGIALVFLTIAVPVQLGGPWIGVAWAVEGVVLIWLSFFVGMPQLRWFGLAAFVITIGYLLLLDLPLDLGESGPFVAYEYSYWPVINLRFLSYVLIIAASYASAFAWWRWRDNYVSPEERHFIPVFLGVANALSLWILSIQVVMAVDQAAIEPNIAGNVISLSLSGLWALYAAVLIVLGIVRRFRLLRLSGLGLLAVPIAKLFVYDAFNLEQEYRVAAFIGLGVLLVVGGFLYQRYSRVIREFLLE